MPTDRHKHHVGGETKEFRDEKSPSTSQKRKQKRTDRTFRLTLHLLPGCSSGGSWRHCHAGHIRGCGGRGSVRGSGCSMGMSSGDCGTVGLCLGLETIAQLRQRRRRHVSRCEGIRIRVPWEMQVGGGRERKNVCQYVVLFTGNHPPT